jgi:hypothetical protein
MRFGLIVPWMLACLVNAATAQVSIGIGLPSVSIGINVPVYPDMVPVPGYPVYYAPQMQSNFFFYDGMYWVYQRDAWYASEWYDGPWGLVEPEYVPLYVLRIPVSYYRDPPVYFRGWVSNAPPRWGEHWGNDWERRRNGWDRWDHNARPILAPLPIYQRQFTGDRYPHGEQQRALRDQNYRYQPRDADVRQHVQDRTPRGAPAAAPAAPRQAQQQQPPPQQGGQAVARPRPPQGATEDARRAAPAQGQVQPQPQVAPGPSAPREAGRSQPPAAPQRGEPAPGAGAGQKTIPRGESMQGQARGQGPAQGQAPGPSQGQGQGQGQGQVQGQGRDRGEQRGGEERGGQERGGQERGGQERGGQERGGQERSR